MITSRAMMPRDYEWMSIDLKAEASQNMSHDAPPITGVQTSARWQ
jgi:hypothetical protein